MTDKLEVGSRVCKADEALEKHNPEEDLLIRGVITGAAEIPGSVFVTWDDSWHKPNPEQVSLEYIISEAEAEEQVSTLEKEYEAWAAQVREKCQAAATLIDEAATIADAHGYVLGDSYDLNDGIRGAMNGAGWRTSSWNC